MRSHKMIPIQASSSQRVSSNLGTNVLQRSAYAFFLRCSGDRKYMVGQFSVPSKHPELLSGQSCMTLPSILNQMSSNQSDSWIPTEHHEVIPSWNRYLGSENGSVLEGTTPIHRCSFKSHLCSLFSTSREGEMVGITFLITHIPVVLS